MASLLRSGVFSTAPTLKDIEALAEEAIAALPKEIRRHLGDLVIHVEDFPDDETLDEMELESPYELMGLYRGISLGHKEGGGQPDDVDHVFLYRRPLLDYWCEAGEDLTRLITHVVVHEVGHHVGFSDEDMERIEGEAAAR
ncbi:MAG: metallopeptidase family protein [Rhodospirillales bacterium]